MSEARNLVEWRRAVLRRSVYRCVKCNQVFPENRMEAHHVQPKAQFPAIRLQIENGVAMCVDCHSAEHGRDTDAWLAEKKATQARYWASRPKHRQWDPRLGRWVMR